MRSRPARHGGWFVHDFAELTIDRTFKLEEIVEAHRYMESNQAKGKIVVEI